MKLETLVCIKTGFIDYTTAKPRFTKDKKYFVIGKFSRPYDSEQSIQVIDDYDKSIYMDRSLFDVHFKYLSDIRDDKLKEIGI
jgi:hypothetical protein